MSIQKGKLTLKSTLQIVMLAVGLTLFGTHFKAKSAVKDKIDLFKGDSSSDEEKSRDNYNKALDGILVISIMLATFSATNFAVGTEVTQLSNANMMRIQGLLALTVLTLASVAILSLKPKKDLGGDEDLEKASKKANGNLVVILILSIIATCVGAQQGFMDAKAVKSKFGFDFAF